MQKLQRGSLDRQKICEPARWKGRDAVRLSNGVVELISLSGGGHLAAFRFLDADHHPLQNVLWEPPWKTYEPSVDWSAEMSRQYGPPETGRFLAGFAGHALCLDYFGDPSGVMRAQGFGLHGEAAAVKWSTASSPTPAGAACRWTARLPVSQLAFERRIRLGSGESVAYVEETVVNECDAEHCCDWVEHVTFGSLFLSTEEGALLASASSGITSPEGYEGRSLLPSDQCFAWPYVLLEHSDAVDLRRPFVKRGRGFLAGLMLDPSRQIEFLLAINWKLRLGVGYCFRRRDFPWMAVWEENRARKAAPWNGITQARGMEFGTKPLPLSETGHLFGKNFCAIPTQCVIAARGRRIARYVMFLFTVPTTIQPIASIADVVLTGDVICFKNGQGDALFSLPAEGCESFLAEK